MSSISPSQRSAVPSWQTALGTGTLAGIVSMRPSLLPRNHLDHLTVFGGSMLIGAATGFAADKLANVVDDHTGLDALGTRLIMAAGGVAVAAGVTIASHGHTTSSALNLARTVGIATAVGTGMGAALIGERSAADMLGNSLPGGTAAANTLLLGGASLGAWYLLAHRPMAAASTTLGRDASAALKGTRVPAVLDETRYARVLAERAAMTTVSGGAGSLLPEAALDTQGFRFIHEATPASVIEHSMGKPAIDPIRAYVGLKHGATPEARADLLVKEMDRLGAFDRKHIFIFSTTGTGYVDPAAAEAVEHVTGGDVALVAAQYGTKPSFLSVGTVPYAIEVNRAITQRVAQRIASMPAGARPTLNLYGESMGAWSSADMYQGLGVKGLADAGVDKALYVGNPRMAKWKREVLPPGHQLDATGTVGAFSDIGELNALSSAQRDQLDVVLWDHHTDPVAYFEPSVAWKQPDYLTRGGRPPEVSRRFRYIPGVTFMQSVVDTKNGTHMVPGVLDNTGHDYRGGMVPFVSATYRQPATDTQIARITESEIQSELVRFAHPMKHTGVPIAAATATHA